MVAGIIFALFLHFRHRWWNSKLVSGGYGVSFTSNVVGMLGAFGMVALAYFFIDYKASSMERSGDGIFAILSMFSAISSVGIAAVVVFIYQVVAVISVWRATAKPGVSFWTKVFCRYALILNLMIAAVALRFGSGGIIFGGILYLAFWFFWGKGRTGVQSPRAERVLPAEMPKAVKEKIDSVASGGIDLADFSRNNAGEPRLADYVQRVTPSASMKKRVHIAPDIPAGKLASAIGSRHFKAGLKNQQPFMLLDDSGRFDGKHGLLVTDEFFDFSFPGIEAVTFSYSFHSDGFDVKGQSVYRGGRKCAEFSNFKEDDLSKIFGVFNEFFADRDAWWRKSAEQGDRNAQFKLASSLVGNKEESMHWLRKAAEQGHPIAQGNLGTYLTSSDPEEAFFWLSRSAAQGNEHSKRRLAGKEFDSYRKKTGITI